MRLRNRDLKTGSLLAHFDPQDKNRNASILFLVAGATDIIPLQKIEIGCQSQIDDHFKWYTVADHLELGAVDANLNPENMVRLEAGEFAGLDEREIETLLKPALNLLKEAKKPLFPSAEGAVGGVAEGIQFLGREEDIQRIKDLIEQDKHLLLVAPRRSGKTSLLRRLELKLGDSARIVFVDLERDNSCVAVAARFRVLAFGERFGLARRKVIESEWTVALREAIEHIASTADNKPLILLLDELVYFLDNLRKSMPASEVLHTEDAKTFLEHFAEVCEITKARIVVAGSLDLGYYVREQLSYSLNQLPGPFGQLDRYVLSPLAESCLKVELRRVLIGTGLVSEEKDLNWLTENVDLAMPYQAMRFIDYLASRIRAESQLDVQVLEKELRFFLDNTDTFTEIESHLERKGQEIPKVEWAIADVLNQITATLAASKAPAIDDIKRKLDSFVPSAGEELFDWLINTFPVRLQDGRVVCASRLFRRWWRRREGAEK